MSIDRWMGKEVVVHIVHTIKYYSAIKKEIQPFVATWMDLEGIVLNEKSDRTRKIL